MGTPLVRVTTQPSSTSGGGGGGGSGGSGVSSVNGRTGHVTLNKSDVSLNNVDNTSDANKPVSTATATALAGKSNVGHTHGGGGGGAVDSVNGETGDVVLDKTDIGLGNVDNTSDAAKPVSTATATALSGKANTSHTHAQSDVTGLSTALAGKSDTGHTHAAADVTSGTLAVARIGSGTAAAGKYVDGGTGAWTALPAGGASAPVAAYPMSEYGMFTSALDPALITDASGLSSGIHVRLPVWAGWRIDGVRYYVETAQTGETGLAGFAVYETGGALAGNTTGNAWGTQGWRSLALSSAIAAQGSDRMVDVAISPGSTSTVKLFWKSGVGGFAADAVNHGGGGRRSLYGYSYGSSWASTFNFSTGGSESTWLPLIGLYGVKV